MKIGVVSDTHGRIHPRVFDLFAGVDHILHAGDIGRSEIVTELRTLAPLTAIHGNVDTFPLVSQFPATGFITLEYARIFIIHIVADRSAAGVRRLLEEAGATGASVIVYGHTHEPRIEIVDNVLLFNPGAAGPARFQAKRPSAGLLTIRPAQPPAAEILWL